MAEQKQYEWVIFERGRTDSALLEVGRCQSIYSHVPPSPQTVGDAVGRAGDFFVASAADLKPLSIVSTFTYEEKEEEL